MKRPGIRSCLCIDLEACDNGGEKGEKYSCSTEESPRRGVQCIRPRSLTELVLGKCVRYRILASTYMEHMPFTQHRFAV